MTRNTGTHNVVGVFPDYATARAVIQQLQESGFPPEKIHVTGNASGQTQNEPKHEGGIAGFFHRLFGSHNQEAKQYYEGAVQKGRALVTVEADQNELDRA